MMTPDETEQPKLPAAVTMGKMGGTTRTEAKAEASRRNGKLGGRPRKDGSPAQPRKAKAPRPPAVPKPSFRRCVEREYMDDDQWRIELVAGWQYGTTGAHSLTAPTRAEAKALLLANARPCACPSCWRIIAAGIATP